MSHAGAQRGLGVGVKQAEFIIWKELRASRGAGAMEIKKRRWIWRARRRSAATDHCHMKSIPTSTQVDDRSVFPGRADSQLSHFKNNEHLKIDSPRCPKGTGYLSSWCYVVFFFFLSGDLHLSNACSKSSFLRLKPSGKTIQTWKH